jgi:hypothetical protein
MNKSSAKRIVEQKILLVPPGTSRIGKRGIPVTLGIGLPTGEYPAKCLICLDGLDKPILVRGNDKWQALFLAINFMRKRLTTFQENGWTIELFEDGCEREGFEPGFTMSVRDLML